MVNKIQSTRKKQQHNSTSSHNTDISSGQFDKVKGILLGSGDLEDHSSRAPRVV
jgi:hypothetical protein